MNNTSDVTGPGIKSIQHAGDYELKLIAEFDAYLPDTSPWEKQE